jgi:ubiquinone/menaquinone biosynthesis C-methylase UbiE
MNVPDATAVNKLAFENVWRSTSSFKQRFQYNAQAARSAFLTAMRAVNIPFTNQQVLDVGFGTGMLMFSFKPTCTLFGTEFSTTAIERARAKARKKGYAGFQFSVPAASEELPFPADTFDVVVCSHVIEHVMHDQDFLDELVRVLRPNGHLVIIAPLDNIQTGTLSEQELINPEFISSGHYHVRNYNADSLLQRFDKTPCRLVFSRRDMHLWDWRVSSVEPARARLRTSRLGTIADQVIGGIINIPLCILPRTVLDRLDDGIRRLGYRPRQMVIVAKKS